MMGQKRKSDPRNVAAFVASQPLYDALRLAANHQIHLGQKSNLIHARDIVQGIHVKLPPTLDQSTLEVPRHERYVDHIVKAFRSSADTYARIFTELVNLTAADPSEGKPAMKGHEAFKAMMDISKTAQSIGAQFTLSEDLHGSVKRASTEKLNGVREEAEDEMPLGTPPMQSPFPTTTKLPNRKRQRMDEDATSQQTLPPQKVQKRDTNAQSNRQANITVPPIQYQDLSAEVEARMKVKEEQKAADRAAKKTEKKRKRESAASELKVASDQDEAVVERPKKKKARKTEDFVTNNEMGAHQTSSAKREAHDDGGTAADTPKKKKLRKSMTEDEMVAGGAKAAECKSMDEITAKEKKEKRKEKRKKDANINGEEEPGPNTSKKRKKSFSSV